MAHARVTTLRRSREGDHRRLSRRCRARLQGIARFALEQPDDLALGTVAPCRARRAACSRPPWSASPMRSATTASRRLQQVYRECLRRRARCLTANASRPHARGARDSGPRQRDWRRLSSWNRSADLERSARRTIAPAESPRGECGLARCCAAGSMFLRAAARVSDRLAISPYALAQLELPAHLLDNVGGMLRRARRQAVGRDDVLVVVSFRNYCARCHRNRRRLRRARRAGASRSPTGPLSPLKPSAPRLLRSRRRSGRNRSARWWRRCASRRRWS